MDYKAMWEELKAQIEKEFEYYADGIECSMMESAHGMFDCEINLKRMKTLEEKYKV